MLNGRYQLTQRIAAGGMGEVWRGDDLLLHREIAVKVLLPALMADSDFITRFRSEARMMAALRHPGVVQVYDYGENAQVGNVRLDFMVMEFIEGTPLSAKIQKAGRLAPAETMAIVAQVAEALQAAHEAGIVHRDVKPSNLLVRQAGAIVLVDFGVARSAGITSMTGTNVVLGSAHYMAPEQAEGHPVTAATDIYALGAVAFSCLTGRPPYVGDNPLAVLAQLVHGKPPVLPPDVPAPVASVVMRALARDPGQRFPSAAAFAAASRGAASHQGPSPYGVSAPNPHQPNPGSGSFRAVPGARSAPSGAYRATSSGPAPYGAAPSGPAPSPSGPFGAAPSPSGPFGAAPSPSGRFGAVPGSAAPQGFATGSASVGAASGAAAGPGTRGYPAGTASVGRPAGSGARGYAAGAASVGAARGSGAGAEPIGASYGTDSGSLTDSNAAGRRKMPVALAAAAVVAVLAGIGIIVGSQYGDEQDTGQLTGAQDPAGEPVTGPDTKTSDRPGQKKPSPGKKTSPPTDPAGEDPATTPTKKPTGGAVAEPTGTDEPEQTEPAKNPEDPAALCGSDFAVVDSKELTTSAGVQRGTIYLLYRAEGGVNCVVTLKDGTLDEKTAMSATLEVQDDKSYAEKGTFQSYAGPVKAAAESTCVKWGGSIGGVSFTSDWSHCN